MPVAERATLSLNDLVLINELNPRERLNEETIIRYMECFESLPPVRVQRGTNVVVDGFHRVEAAIRLGLEAVPIQEEPIPDDELRMVAGLANVQHGQPLTRAERNKLAVALVRNYGKLREEAAELLGMSPSGVTLALREHQFNEQLSEKLGSAVQVINSSHVRALYRVGPEQRERLLEAVVTKVDEDGQPYPLTGAELKLLVDRMLDPATPTAELNRLLNDPRARPKPPSNAVSNGNGAEGAVDPFMPEAGSNTRPWEQEWESPLKGGDSEAFDNMRAVDDELRGQGAYAGEEKQLNALLGRAEQNAREREQEYTERYVGETTLQPTSQTVAELLEGINAAATALEELVPLVEPDPIRRQVQAVHSLLQSLL
jgi:ParB-like chromosome segregation protein Spo0J